MGCRNREDKLACCREPSQMYAQSIPGLTDLLLHLRFAHWSFDDDGGLFRDQSGDQLERPCGRQGKTVMATGRVHLADVDLFQTIPKCSEQMVGFDHSRIHLVGMTDVEAESGFRKRVEYFS